MSEKDRVFEYRLDFLYQSIAVYAGTLVVYLLVRGEFLGQQFPVVTEDPILGLLSLIILISIAALIYNLILRRRVIISDHSLRFSSAVRERILERSDVIAIQFAREGGTTTRRGLRVIRIRVKDKRRAYRIYPHKFTDTRSFIESLKAWAGPLAIERGARLRRKQRLEARMKRSASSSMNPER